MTDKITIRAIIEVVGTPKEHVEKSMKTIIENVLKDESLEVLNKRTEAAEKQQTDQEEKGTLKELWATFVEMEIRFSNLTSIGAFCFNFMPSSIEIIEPSDFELPALPISNLFNDLQFRLHGVNKAIHELQSENQNLNRNLHNLMQNYILTLLTISPRTYEEVAKATGTNVDTIKTIIQNLTNKGLVVEQDGKFKRKE